MFSFAQVDIGSCNKKSRVSEIRHNQSIQRGGSSIFPADLRLWGKNKYYMYMYNSPFVQIQIHGPVCLSENVDCIVVNERHSADPTMKELLDQFVSRNKCNLIWMEPADRIDYPSFTHAPAVAAGFSLFVPPPLPIFSAPALPAPGTYS